MRTIEFDEILSKRYEGEEAFGKRILYRLKTRVGNIPYYPKGIPFMEFNYVTDIGMENDIYWALRDLSAQISFPEKDRIRVAHIETEYPQGEYQ